MTDPLVRVQGAGPVGLMFALFLRQNGWDARRIELIDRTIEEPAPAYRDDPRVLALSHGTLSRLSLLGIDHDATRITRIHVSCEGRFGMMEIDGHRAGVDELGALLGYGDLLSRLREKAMAMGLTITAKADPSSIPDVLVIAEGGLYRDNDQPSDASVFTRDYHQHAVIGWVQTQPAPSDTAYERFTDDGAIALLPLKGRYALIWCCSPERADGFCNANAAMQAEMISTVMRGRLSPITSVAVTGRYPLGMKWRNRIVSGNTVWIGNSAQTLHPIAGQGMNLGFRDAQTLATCLVQHGQAIGARLGDYERKRAVDRWTIRVATDSLGRQAWVRRAVGAVALVPGAKRLLGQVLMYGG